MAEAGQDHACRHTRDQHRQIGVRRGECGQQRSGREARAKQRPVDPGVPPSHPHPQASGLVVLQLEQVQHLVQAPGDQREHAERGGDQADRHHLRRSFAAAWRGWSSRNRRATALNWPGESA